MNSLNKEATNQGDKADQRKEMVNADFICKFLGCGKKYLSVAALYTHKKTKGHFISEEENKKSNKGRPKKIQENSALDDDKEGGVHHFFEFLDNMRQTLIGCMSSSGLTPYEIAKENTEKEIYQLEDIIFWNTNLKEELDLLSQEYGKLIHLVSVIIGVAKNYLTKYFNLPFLQLYCPLILEFAKMNLKQFSEAKTVKTWLEEIRSSKFTDYISVYKSSFPEAKKFENDLEIVECLDGFLEMCDWESENSMISAESALEKGDPERGDPERGDPERGDLEKGDLESKREEIFMEPPEPRGENE